MPDPRLAWAAASLLLLGARAAPDSCAALRALAIPNVEIASAVEEQGICSVAGVARPRANAAIGFELWLPAPNKWSGRYYQMGNGGFAGNINSPALRAATERGDAAAATDMGHKGTGFDAAWAMGRPDLVDDYGHRAIKVTSDTARVLTTAYYGRPARQRYYMGCSNGGRQALMAASRYPADWDGVIAGAPAADWTRQFERFARIQQAVRRAGGWIEAPRLAAILSAARSECAGRSMCGFTSMALSPGERATLRAIETAGYPASSAIASEWGQWIFSRDPKVESQVRLAEGAFRYVVRSDPDWTAERYDARRDAPSTALRRTLDVGSLAPFTQRGGKIISYYGWADAVLPPAAGLAFHARQAGPGYRLFMIPGMKHCQGGEGATSFGQSLAAPALRDDPEHDIRRALEAWVEKGKAPGRLVAVDNLTGLTHPIRPAGTRKKRSP